MDYPQALAYLRDLTKFGVNLGLGRMEELLERLGNPHRRLRFFHIGGTNGKGSVAAMVAAILQAAGYRVGLFTSPHLHSYTERIRLNGQEIRREHVAEILTRMRPLLDGMVKEGHEHPTEFEVSTALAFHYFNEVGADYVVLEVGLGGSFDSTNVIPSSLVSVITNVGLDHMDYLGHTLVEIAGEKAGIIKDRAVVVTGADKPEALEVIETRCRRKGAILYRLGKEFTYNPTEVSCRGGRMDWKGLGRTYPGLRVALLGRHQLSNAALAVAVMEAARRHHNLDVLEEHIREGLDRAFWPGRLEIVNRRPLVVLDGAHNYDGALALKRSLEELFPHRRLILVLGMLADKEREKVVAALVPLAQAVIITRPNNPRAGDWKVLGLHARRFTPHVHIIRHISQAMETALGLAGPEDLICATGSLYMVAEAREWFLMKKKEDFAVK
ncbi:bifunctional folylpolyglutamate synthase/dihydrofolate synthase [Thermanaeromonas sp. C210]|uniref:bifunctional folylpolyglutamate synthase/dihydrofolate synthase n=1 Tax=Thermanaeromonas sp. C210 TaxID=2731925 RepID=UPI00155C77E7|nr:folylpolyglutamate synthase/dihydrofolate synthase family protein [Thermanaeromonas sp. C210]GFN22609.1 bifunctional folylpolyglutamate synthase/dihydrofolate synthase [Thermanaeromonas sp. C210]